MEHVSVDKASRRQLLVVRILAVFAVVLACLRIAWLSDDALITLRTALNITHGWGPGFNATESVQAYTHPLWFLLWVGMGAMTNQWVLGILLLGLTCTGLAVAILAWSTRSIPRIVVAALLLIACNAFVEYATSGLENPLAYLLLAVLMAIGLRSRTWRLPPLLLALLAGATVAAVLLTRLDLAVLLVPVLVYATARLWRHWGLIAAASLATLIPLAVWFTWSKMTYGTWLPNTFEAKRNLQIPESELVVQGFRYLWVTFEHDPVSLVVIASGVLVAAICSSWMARSWALGVVAYIAYVVWVGGDFMAGRFMAVPVFVCVFLLATTKLPSEASPAPRDSVKGNLALGLLMVLVLVVGATLAGATPNALLNSQAERWKVDQNFNAGVDDERGVYVSLGRDLKGYVDRLSLAFLGPNFAPIGDGSGLNRGLRDLDREAKAWPAATERLAKPSEVGTFCGFLGTIGIATGPTTHLIDRCALTDRFLASVPYVPESPFAWKPGHFEREIPEGYEDAVRENNPELIKDPALRFYLKKLWSEIRG